MAKKVRIHRGEEELKRHNVKWGLLSLVILVPLIYLGFSKAIPFRSHYEVQAIFPSAATQLSKNSPVRIAGVNVGKVTKVEHGPGTTARVTMRIKDDGRPLHTDATMKIRPRLFLEGNFFVDVRPGTSAAPEVPDDGTIPLTQTAIPVQFDQVLSTFDQDGRANLQTTIKELARGVQDGGAQGVNAAFKDAPQGLTGLARTSAALRGVDPDDLSRFVANTAIVSHALAVRPDELRGLLRGLNTTIGALAAKAPQLNTSLDELSRVLTAVPPAARQANRVLGPVTKLAVALRPALDRAPGALRPANALLRSARPLLADSQLPRLARTATPALQTVDAQIPSLDALFQEVTPTAQCVSKIIVPTLGKTLDDGKLSTGLPVWQELVRFGIGLAAGSSQYNGNGHQVRLNVGVGEATLGTIPGLGEVVSSSTNGLSGARPLYTPGKQPPFRPDVDCTTQQPPNLDANAAPAPASRRYLTPKQQVQGQLQSLEAVKRLLRQKRGDR
jgi:phospholipid/cholesterol/gamma-HCH transport system substrate-binding protein